MAEIDYFAIEETIAKILREDDLTREVNGRKTTVLVEEPLKPKSDTCPWVGIYLDAWDSPSGEELIAPGSGQSVRTFIMYELWMYEYALDNRQSSIKLMNLFSKVKEVLKRLDNRMLDDKVLVTTFVGGRFENQKDEAKRGAFFKGVSLKLKVEVRE